MEITCAFSLVTRLWSVECMNVMNFVILDFVNHVKFIQEILYFVHVELQKLIHPSNVEQSHLIVEALA